MPGGVKPSLPSRDAERVAETVTRLIARASTEVPATGSFEPVVEHCPITHPGHAGVRALVLRIGPGQEDATAKRFYDVRVRTADEASDSSTWLHFAERDALLTLLRDPATGVQATLAAIEAAVESLAHHQLR